MSSRTVLSSSIFSAPKEDRINARRLRILKRSEAKKKGGILNQTGEDTILFETPEKSFISQEDVEKKKQDIIPSRVRWKQQSGLLNLTNTVVHFFQKESRRRKKEEDMLYYRKKDLDELEESLKVADKFFDILKSKWKTKNEKSPLKDRKIIWSMICSFEQILDDKDEKIAQVKERLKKKEEEFELNLKYLQENILTIINKSDEIIKNLYELTNKEISYCSEVMNKRQKNLAQRHSKDCLLELRSYLDNEEKFREELEIQQEKERADSYNLRMELVEKMNETQRQLNLKIADIQLKLSEMKTECLLNEAKLEHNIEVLQKREIEYIKAHSEQKRKLNRLKNQEISLINHHRNLVRKRNLEIKKLLYNIDLLVTRIASIKKNTSKCQKTNENWYHSIWNSKEEDAKRLLEKLINADKIIHEQLLGIDWSVIDTSFTQNRGPLTKKNHCDANLPFIFKNVTPESDWPKNLRCFLENVCNHMGFLVEEKVMTILKQLPKNEQSLISIDEILAIFNIKDKTSLAKLTKYLLKYAEEDGNDNCYNLISSEGILNAFKELVIDYRLNLNLASEDNSDGINESKYEFGEQDMEYWNQYIYAFHKPRICLWDGLFQIQKQYAQILKRRAKLMDQKEKIIRQNKDLEITIQKVYLRNK